MGLKHFSVVENFSLKLPKFPNQIFILINTQKEVKRRWPYIIQKNIDFYLQKKRLIKDRHSKEQRLFRTKGMSYRTYGDTTNKCATCLLIYYNVRPHWTKIELSKWGIKKILPFVSKSARQILAWSQFEHLAPFDTQFACFLEFETRAMNWSIFRAQR